MSVNRARAAGEHGDPPPNVQPRSSGVGRRRTVRNRPTLAPRSVPVRRRSARGRGAVRTARLEASGPQLSAVGDVVIEGLDGTDAQQGGRLAVLSKIHHAVIDGVSAASLMSRLCSLAPDSPPPETISGAGGVSTLRLALGGAANVAKRPVQLAGLLSRTVSTAFDIVRRMRGGRTMAAPFAAPATAFNVAVAAVAPSRSPNWIWPTSSRSPSASPSR